MINKEYIEDLLNQIKDIDFFIVDIKISPSSKISIFIDNNEGIKISECQQISKELYPAINEKIENFELEVSSPGLTGALKVWQQYAKLIGEEIEIRTTDEQNYTAKILDADSEKVKVLKGEDEILLAYNQIKKAKQIIKF